MHQDPQRFGDITTQVVSNDWQSTQKKMLKPRKLNLRFHYRADLWHILETAVKDVNIRVKKYTFLRRNW